MAELNRIAHWHMGRQGFRWACVLPDESINIFISRVYVNGCVSYTAYHDDKKIQYSTYNKLRACKDAAERYVIRGCK